MTYKEEARESLEKLVKALPFKLTEDQTREVEEAIYDFVGQILDAVREEYHVVSK